MPRAAAAAPARRSITVTGAPAAVAGGIIDDDEDKPRLSRSSAKWRSSVGVSGPLARPKMKAKTATTMKTSSGTVTGAVTMVRRLPVTSCSSQTPTTAPGPRRGRSA
jgi:hypothetical protein